VKLSFVEEKDSPGVHTGVTSKHTKPAIISDTTTERKIESTETSDKNWTEQRRLNMGLIKKIGLLDQHVQSLNEMIAKLQNDLRKVAVTALENEETIRLVKVESDNNSAVIQYLQDELEEILLSFEPCEGGDCSHDHHQ